MLGIVRIQPPTGSPYFEPPVVRRMAAELPPARAAFNNGLGLVYMQPPLPGSIPPTGSAPPVVTRMAANLPNRFRNNADIPFGIRPTWLSGGTMKQITLVGLGHDHVPYGMHGLHGLRGALGQTRTMPIGYAVLATLAALAAGFIGGIVIKGR